MLSRHPPIIIGIQDFSLHGKVGLIIPLQRDYLNFFGLDSSPVRKFLSNGVKILRKRITINMISRLYSPENPVRELGQGLLSDRVNKNLSYCIFLKIPHLMWDLNGVYHKDLENLHKLFLPSE